jgi:hypothetical protein
LAAPTIPNAGADHEHDHGADDGEDDLRLDHRRHARRRGLAPRPQRQRGAEHRGERQADCGFGQKRRLRDIVGLGERRHQINLRAPRRRRSSASGAG